MPSKPSKELALLPTLSKQRIARLLSRRTGLTNQKSLDVVDALVIILSDHLAAGGRIEIANFLTLTVETHTRVIIDPLSTQNTRPFHDRVAPYVALKCKPGNRLRTRLAALATKNARR